MILRSHKKLRTNTLNNTYGVLNVDCMIRILAFLPLKQLVHLTVLNSSYRRLIQTTAELYTDMEYLCEFDDLKSIGQLKSILAVANYVKNFSINVLDSDVVRGTHYEILELMLKFMPTLDSFTYHVMLRFPPVHFSYHN